MSDSRRVVLLLVSLFGCGQAQESRSPRAAEQPPLAAFANTTNGAALRAASTLTPSREQRPSGNANANATRTASFTSPRAATRATGKGCPGGMAIVTGYCIDRFEAYVVELDEQGREMPHSPYAPVDGLRVRAKVAEGVLPQGYISQVQADQACKNAGKRLCSAPELSLACRGPDAHASYPYGGNRRQRGKCNEGKGSAVSVVFGQTADYGNAELNDPRLNQWHGGLAKTGEYAASVSPFGVFDLVGNLHEWSAEVAPNGHGFFHGGFYGDAELNGPGCNYVTKAHASNYHDYSTGFRCCQDASSDPE